VFSRPIGRNPPSHHCFGLAVSSVPYALCLATAFGRFRKRSHVTPGAYITILIVPRNVYSANFVSLHVDCCPRNFLFFVLGYPLAYYVSFYAKKRKDLIYQLVIIPLWVSYLVRALRWKTILGSDGVLNTLLHYVHLTQHPLNFLHICPFASCLHSPTLHPFGVLPI